MMNPTSIIVWNIREGHNAYFKRNFKELLRTHNPCMVTLLKTKMTNHLGVKEEFGFDYLLEVSVMGRVGGIVLLWNATLVTITGLRQSVQELHTMIQVSPNQEPWCISVIYASPRKSKRLLLWKNLRYCTMTFHCIM